MSKKKFVHMSTRLIDSEVGDLVRREVAKRTDPERIRASFLLMKSGKAFVLLPSKPKARPEALLSELPRRMVSQSKARRGSFRHLFSDDGGQPDVARAQYQREVRELHRLLESLPPAQLRRYHPELERQFQLMYQQLSGTVDDYDALKVETTTLNLILRTLYPGKVKEETLDAHHIIEDRTYDAFKDTWKMLGWDSPGAMPAIPLVKEYHRRSPKRLPGIEKRIAEIIEETGEDISSLSQELQARIDLKKIKTPEALIDAYATYYQKQAIAKDVLPVLTAVSQEITRRRTAAAIVQEAKKLSQP